MTIELNREDYPINDGWFRVLKSSLELRQRFNPEEDESTLISNTIKELAEEQGHPWLKLYPPANQLPGSKYETITDAQLAAWEWDENHMIHITIPKEHLLDWFNHVEINDEDDDQFNFDFTKYDEDTFMISESNPDFWTECSDEDFEQAVLDKLNLKKEWVDGMTVDG